MTGLEKMKSQIIDEARTLAETKIREAEEKAGKILDDARDEARKTSEEISRKSQAETANYKDKVASSIDLQHRTRILAARQDMIKEVLADAYEELVKMKEEEYYRLLLKLVDKYALPEDGELFLSRNDTADKPLSFAVEVQKIASEKGGSIRISEKGRDIENGFVLAYGGLEENCTLRAMFDDKREELSDVVREILFA